MKSTFLALIAILFISCNSKDSDEIIDYTAANEAEIIKYIADNNLEATRSETGLYYVVNEEGTGKQPTTASNVTVGYKGYFTSKKVFDQNSALTFGMTQVIPGWTEGIQYFKEGGSGLLIVPSRLGYGNTDRGPIPAGSVLVFEVNLISVNN